jgi:hypothetical protein
VLLDDGEQVGEELLLELGEVGRLGNGVGVRALDGVDRLALRRRLRRAALLPGRLSAVAALALGLARALGL